MTKTDAPDSQGTGTSDGKPPAELTASSIECWASVQEVINAIPQYVLLIDEGHRILLANTAVQDALGVDPAWILGQYCPRVIHGTENPFPGCPLEESVLRGGIAVEKKLHDDARGRWLLAGIYPTGLRSAEGRRVFLHTTRDITEEERAAEEQRRREQAEEELRRSFDMQRVTAAIVRLSLENVPVEKLLNDALDLVLSIPWLALESKGAIFLAEGRPDSLVMKAVRGLPPEVQQACARVPFGRCLCGRAAESGQTVFASELDGRHEMRYAGIAQHGHYCVPIMYQGRALGVINTYIKPGSERRRVEEEFLTAVANTIAGVLTRMKAEQERSSIEEQLRQSQKMDAIGRLAGGVAHDFNNLLAVILSYSDMLKEEIGPRDPLIEMIEDIRGAATKAADLTRQLLTFSRRQIIEPRLFDVNEVTLSIEKMLRRLVGENVAIRTEFEENLGLVFLDRGQFEQVIVNLVVNSRDAMPQGGEIRISTSTAERALSSGAASACVLFSVGDTGQGIPPEILPKIFEPFFTTKARGRGTGLGLATVWGVIKQAGGDIEVSSTPGKGTTFSIYLPRAEAGRKADAAAAAPLAATGPVGATILLVEDEDSLRKVIARQLVRRGYVVIEASSGEQAVETAARLDRPIALLLTDVVMPGMNGRQAALEIAKSRQGIRTLYMTGYPDETIAPHGVLDPALPILRKPFSPAELFGKVAEVLAGGGAKGKE